MKAINIKWDIDCPEEFEELPIAIEIPEDIIDEDVDEYDYEAKLDAISDYITDITGFCHKGFEMED